MLIKTMIVAPPILEELTINLQITCTLLLRGLVCTTATAQRETRFMPTCKLRVILCRSRFSCRVFTQSQESLIEVFKSVERKDIFAI